MEVVQTHHLSRRLVETVGPFGITFDSASRTTAVVYFLLTAAANGIIPIPIANVMCVIGVLLWGWLYGFLINLVAAVSGCIISLVVFRLFRPFFLGLLGNRANQWQALDSAVAAEGCKIALLLRLTPVIPVVPTNMLLALTSIDAWTFMWTSLFGFIPGSIPFAYAGVMGVEAVEDFPPRNPMLLATLLLGVVATLLAAWKLGSIATNELCKAGVDTSAGYKPLTHVDVKEHVKVHKQSFLLPI